MKNLGRTVLITILGMCLAGYLLFFIISVIQFPTGDLLSIYFWRWVFSEALIKLFSYAIPIGCSSLIIAISFALPSSSNGSQNSAPFSSIINSTIILILTVLCVFEVSKETLIPRIKTDVEGMLYKTEIAENAKAKAEDFYKRNLLTDANEMVSLYLEIDPENKGILKLKEDIHIKQSLASTENSKPLQKTENAMEEQRSKNLSVSEFIEKAEYYYKMRDYYSAHYFANQALTIDPDRVDVKNLASLSWKKIEELEQNAKTKNEAQYFKRKKAGYSALQERQYIDAYYIFETLREEQSADDPDIQKYFKEAESMVKTTTFFIDEVEKVRVQPGEQDILFLNRSTKNDPKQFVYFNRYVISRTGTYAFGIEILQLNASNTIEFHLSAQYGKIIDTSNGTMLLLKGISRMEENITVAPTFYVEPPPSDFPSYIIPIHASVNAISICNIHDSFIKNANITALMSFRTQYHLFGYSENTINMELINRLRDPFMFLILMFFAMCLGWITRVPDSGRKTYMYLIIPAIPFLFTIAAQAYKSAGSIVYMFFLLQLGFGITIAIVIIFSIILLFLSLFTLALQTSRS